MRRFELLHKAIELAADEAVAVTSPGWHGNAFVAMLSGSMVPRRSEARHGRGPRTKRGDVAIVGVGAVAPGAKDAQSLWQNVIAKTDAIRDLPASHFDVAKYLSLCCPQELPRPASRVSSSCRPSSRTR